MKKLSALFLVLGLTASLTTGASAAGPLEYAISAPGDPDYGKPTSIEVIQTVDGGAMKNEDASKNAALIPPAFGSPSADTRNTGIPLTPNLASSSMATLSAVVNGTTAAVVEPGSVLTIAPPATGVATVTTIGYTKVTNDLYYAAGHLGTLKIPAIGLTVKIYQGTDSSALAKGAGHFEETSIWDGNVALAGHNRGVNNHFGQIHTLELGDKIILTTRLGSRTYEVISVEKVNEQDTSGLAPTAGDQITLYTCVRNQRENRWKVVGAAV